MRSCFNSNKITIDTQDGGYLASVVTMETGLGTKTCPWVLQARPGQRINVTVWDFTGPVTIESREDRRDYENEVYKVGGS